jgi:hypothetical protein
VRFQTVCFFLYEYWSVRLIDLPDRRPSSFLLRLSLFLRRHEGHLATNELDVLGDDEIHRDWP